MRGEPARIPEAEAEVKTWEEELKERFLREGKTSGEARAWREALQTCLQQRFQTLPDESVSAARTRSVVLPGALNVRTPLVPNWSSCLPAVL